MPARDPLPRRPTRLRDAPRSAAVAAAMLVAGLGSGCSSLEAGAAGAAPSDVVSDLAAQVERSTSLTYAADYHLSGGRTARIAQAQTPPRAAYVYPGGMVAVTADATTRCRAGTTSLTCTKTAPPAPAAAIVGAEPKDAGRNGMVTPSVLLALLNATASDGDAVVDPHDTTIAGRHATCVAVRNVDDAAASRFNACVTTEGVLGSFAGTVDGTAIDVAMTRFQDSAEGVTFDPPAGAKVIDRR